MALELTSVLFQGASAIGGNSYFGYWPSDYTGIRDEFLATRTTASLGFSLWAAPTTYDLTGTECETLLNRHFVNKDFRTMAVGDSKHALAVNEDGYIIASGVVLKRAEGHFRTYFLVPALQYYVEHTDLDVQGVYVFDEYFLQLDGPKSLEILEDATQTDLHDLGFAKHTDVKIANTDMTVFRLGMTGALAYELHGNVADAEAALTALRASLEKFGGRMQGTSNYVTVEHTPGGYTNAYAHHWYPDHGPGTPFFDILPMAVTYAGSAADDENNFYLNPYEIGWGRLVNFDREEFQGREALLRLKDNHRQMVTLEWDAEDVGRVFASQFKGSAEDACEPIDYPSYQYDPRTKESGTPVICVDYVCADGRNIGVSMGRTYAYYEHRMISLACIEPQYAKEGTKVVVRWGTPGTRQVDIKATVARFPYYRGEYRNETCDTSRIPRLEQ